METDRSGGGDGDSDGDDHHRAAMRRLSAASIAALRMLDTGGGATAVPGSAVTPTDGRAAGAGGPAAGKLSQNQLGTEILEPAPPAVLQPEVRVQVIRHARTHSVGKYQLCMF